MTDTQQGRCAICYVAGPSGHRTNFICEKCCDPDRIVVVCECGDRATFDPADADIIALHVEEPIEIKAGTVLKLPYCAKCLKGKPPRNSRIECYQTT